MAETLSHRGPDDAGTWTDHECGIALGFRRLAILELSPLGHQPMASESGRYVVVFNGEIYNFKELRRELESFDHRFRGGSDTEVILAATEEWGFEKAVRRFNGMFALALWDRQSRSLSLARDHLGIKPVYYGWCGQTLLFASELKALRAHPEYHAEVDRNALALYVRHSFVPGPFSIYRDTFKLEPGCVVTFHCPQTRAVPIQYWSVTETAERGIAEPDRRLTTEVLDDLQSLLATVVKQQMVADVALGAFLSGGIDSSLVVALMQSQSTSPVRTFSIGFEEEQFDETPYARTIARHLGTNHTEMYVTARDAHALIPTLPDIYDEPFADSSGIPTSLLARLTRQHVTVSLTGDGGDELFGGYWQYWELPKRWRAINRLPEIVRRTVAGGLFACAHGLNGIQSPIAERIAKSVSSRARYYTASHPDEFIRLYLNRWVGTPSVVLDAAAPSFWLDSCGAGRLSEAIAERFMLVDTKLGLPDDMLTKVDRAASAASLETRVPLLDPRLVAFAWRLPLWLKVGSHARGKWILRALLRRYLPAESFERAKQGFGVPIARWVRGPLRDWSEALLDETRLRREGFLDAQRVRSEWRYLVEGRHDWEAEIWSILMFQAWHERWVK